MTEGTNGTPENELAALVGPVWSRARARGALRLTPDELLALRDEGRLLEVVTADGHAFYPVFQFEQTGNVIRVRPALAAVTRVLRGFDPWTVAVLLNTPAPELNGSTPLEWLATGGSAQDVEELARVVLKEWSAGDYPTSDEA